MPVFQYKAKKKNAETVSGHILAADKNDAVDKINQLGLVPMTIKDESQSFSERDFLRRGKVSTQELFVFSRQLVNLLKAGVSLLRALEIITAQIKNRHFQLVVQNIRYGLKEGKSFSEALAEYPHIFSFLYITLVKAGEESGHLRETILDMAEYLRRQEEIASKVRTALAYPILMALLGAGTVIFILTFVMPKMMNLYENFKQTLPVSTTFLIGLSVFLLNHAASIIVGVVFFFFIFQKWGNTKQGKRFKSQIKLKVPYLGNFLLHIELARFCRTLELLLKSGVTIVRAMQLSIPIINNDLIREQLMKCQEDLIAGRSLSQSIKEKSLIPSMMGDLISVGEESGNLSETIHDIAESYEQETNEIIKIMTTLLEPLMILTIGLIVGFIVMAMLLPIFQLDVLAR